ncbi:MAG TPA: L-seryl-tRNA(Sec) selenium transferase [Candidatus Dormibacteraeota bacterium]|nr:L-seryl-tRNA(Sec) selenium transferase [Candidatus Dormibacteraeota bacterium]
MSPAEGADPRRGLPSVEALVTAAHRKLDGRDPVTRDLLTALARARLAEARERDDRGTADKLAVTVAEEARRLLRGTLVPVINATGVALQTNLGRAPLSEAALERVAAVGRGYSSLEFDLERGRRSERSISLSRTLEALLGVPAVVVNNNAASLVLSLFALARGKEVIVSRGELIEIGGSFRLPDVMRISGARLVEVGTTNRTRAADYGEAITPKTAMLLKVHASNYQVVGFTESVADAELAALAHENDLVVMEDLGSGALVGTEAAGLAHEPTAQDALAAGVDLVAFSADKLMGGPQAGVVAGRPDLVRKLGRSPLYRALRPDKMTLAALEATLGAYLAGASADLPLWRMLHQDPATTKARAEGWAVAAGQGEVVELESPVGGGSLPGQTLKGFGLALGGPGARPSADTVARRLRRGSPPVVARIHDDRVILDPRTVLPDQDIDVAAALKAALG